MKSELPSRSIPKIYSDLNACGLSDEPDDDCYYGLSRQQIAALHPAAGMKVFVWDVKTL
jgi:hypothetical protein